MLVGGAKGCRGALAHLQAYAGGWALAMSMTSPRPQPLEAPRNVRDPYPSQQSQPPRGVLVGGRGSRGALAHIQASAGGWAAALPIESPGLGVYVEEEIMERASVAVQCAWRCRTARSRAVERRTPLTPIQAWRRRFAVRRSLRRRRSQTQRLTILRRTLFGLRALFGRESVTIGANCRVSTAHILSHFGRSGGATFSAMTVITKGNRSQRGA